MQFRIHRIVKELELEEATVEPVPAVVEIDDFILPEPSTEEKVVGKKKKRKKVKKG